MDRFSEGLTQNVKLSNQFVSWNIFEIIDPVKQR